MDEVKLWRINGRPVVKHIGYVGHSIESLNEMMVDEGVTVLVDIRSVPLSKYYHWFNSDKIKSGLECRYMWAGNHLGGKGMDWNNVRVRRKWEEALKKMVDKLCVKDNVCLMCCEKDWWRCHRKILVDILVGEFRVHCINL